MSIVSVNRLREKKATDVPKGKTYIRKYRVLTDDENATEKQVLAAGGIPDFYEELDDDSTVTCKRRVPEQNPDNLLEWTVTCEYTTREGDEDEPGTATGKPTDEDPKITFGFARYTVAVDKSYKTGDTRGAQSIPVRNSAGDEFDPPIVEEKVNLLITIVRNETYKGFNPADPYNFIGTINKSKILIAGVSLAAWTGLMREMGAVKMWDSDGDAYYQVTYQIEGDPETHVKKVLDQGFSAIFGAEKRRIIGGDTVPKPDNRNPDSFVSEPQKLDLAGSLFTPTADEKAKYISFYTKWKKEWKGLGLPANF